MTRPRWINFPTHTRITQSEEKTLEMQARILPSTIGAAAPECARPASYCVNKIQLSSIHLAPHRIKGLFIPVFSSCKAFSFPRSRTIPYIDIQADFHKYIRKYVKKWYLHFFQGAWPISQIYSQASIFIQIKSKHMFQPNVKLIITRKTKLHLNLEVNWCHRLLITHESRDFGRLLPPDIGETFLLSKISQSSSFHCFTLYSWQYLVGYYNKAKNACSKRGK